MTPATAYLMPSGGRRIALRMLMPMVSEDAASTWIHIASEGTWCGHRDGEFTFDRAGFDQVVRNFKANPNQTPMDYLHTTENPEALEAPASGWVQKMEVRTDDSGSAQLWAFVELTEKAADHIRAGEYRYCSGVFDFDGHDLVSGDAIGVTMPSLALVNTPFIRGSAPIRLSQRQSAPGDNEMTFSKKTVLALTEVKVGSLVEALDQIEGDTVTPEQLEAAAAFAAAKDGTLEEASEVEADLGGINQDDSKTADVASLAEDDEEEKTSLAQDTDEEEEKALAEVGGVEPEVDEERPALADPAMEEAALAELMAATGMDLPALKAAIAANLAAVVSAITGALDTPAAPEDLGPAGVQSFSLQLSTAQGQVKALSVHAAKLETELATHRGAEADRLVKALADEGKIPIGLSDKWRKVCLSDRATFDTLTKDMPQVIPMGDHAVAVAPGPAVSDVSDIDENDEFVKRTRVNLRTLSKEGQDKAIRKGLLALAERA